MVYPAQSELAAFIDEDQFDLQAFLGSPTARIGATAERS